MAWKRQDSRTGDGKPLDPDAPAPDNLGDELATTGTFETKKDAVNEPPKMRIPHKGLE